MTLDTMMAGGVTLGGVQIYNDIQHPHLRMAPGNTRSTGNTTGAAATLPYSLHGLYRACWHYKQCQQDNSIVIIQCTAGHEGAVGDLSCMSIFSACFGLLTSVQLGQVRFGFLVEFYPILM